MEENNISEEVKEEQKELKADEQQASQPSEQRNVGFGLSIAGLATSVFAICMYFSCLLMKLFVETPLGEEIFNETGYRPSFNPNSIKTTAVLVIVAAAVALTFGIISLLKCLHQEGVKNKIGRIFSIVAISASALFLLISPILFISFTA